GPADAVPWRRRRGPSLAPLPWGGLRCPPLLAPYSHTARAGATGDRRRGAPGNRYWWRILPWSGRLQHQGGKGGRTRPSARRASQPGHQANDVERRGNQDMLQMGLGLANVAGAPQIKDAHRLGEGAFAAGAGRVAGLKRVRLLAGAGGLERLMLRLGPQRQAARVDGGPRTL